MQTVAARGTYMGWVSIGQSVCRRLRRWQRVARSERYPSVKPSARLCSQECGQVAGRQRTEMDRACRSLRSRRLSEPQPRLAARVLSDLRPSANFQTAGQRFAHRLTGSPTPAPRSEPSQQGAASPCAAPCSQQSSQASHGHSHIALAAGGKTPVRSPARPCPRLGDRHAVALSVPVARPT